MQPAGHLDGAAERDLAVALAEMQIPHGEAAALHIDREVDFRSARQVLDVAIAAMLARRHGAGALGADLFPWGRPFGGGAGAGCAAMKATSRWFHVASRLASGRQPISPG